MNYPRLCQARKIDYIFDPGQSLPMLTGEDLLRAIGGCRILIANDYELDLILGKTGLGQKGLLQRAGVIVTTGRERFAGSYRGRSCIPAANPKIVKDPTGAGDSYRGGLISGLVQGEDLGVCPKMGSVCASFAVECYGTQEYRFSPEEFRERYRRCFG